MPVFFWWFHTFAFGWCPLPVGCQRTLGGRLLFFLQISFSRFCVKFIIFQWFSFIFLSNLWHILKISNSFHLRPLSKNNMVHTHTFFFIYWEWLTLDWLNLPISTVSFVVRISDGESTNKNRFFSTVRLYSKPWNQDFFYNKSSNLTRAINYENFNIHIFFYKKGAWWMWLVPNVNTERTGKSFDFHWTKKPATKLSKEWRKAIIFWVLDK